MNDSRSEVRFVNYLEKNKLGMVLRYPTHIRNKISNFFLRVSLDRYTRRSVSISHHLDLKVRSRRSTFRPRERWGEVRDPSPNNEGKVFRSTFGVMVIVFGGCRLRGGQTGDGRKSGDEGCVVVVWNLKL